MRGVQSYLQINGVAAGFHSNQLNEDQNQPAESGLVSVCVEQGPAARAVLYR